ncbi:hypothetical protein [Aquipuribacter nitratireducens]|uniref:Uncharacterized protein n=1 Tax=Aquipuribacter nitratireducens TaxID=650104 RepID=A0ABW0GKJ6_9MICO
MAAAAVVGASAPAGAAVPDGPSGQKGSGGDVSGLESGLEVRPAEGADEAAASTARAAAAASATVRISSCFVLDSWGTVEVSGVLVADSASATTFTVVDSFGFEEPVDVPAGAAVEFSYLEDAGPTSVEVRVGGSTIAGSTRDVPDCTPTTIAPTGRDELIRWEGDALGEFVDVLADGNTEFLRELRLSWDGRDSYAAVAVEADRTAGEELLRYNIRTGNKQVIDPVVGADGGLDLQWLAFADWSPGWSTARPVELDGTPGSELVLYNATTGRQVILDFIEDGRALTVSDRQWSKGWDVVEPIQLDADSLSELVVYNSLTGRQVLVNLFPNGTTGTYSDRQWSRGWDTVEPIELDGDRLSELMVYNSTTGRQVLVNLFADGSTGTFSDRQWSKGWDVVTALESDTTALSELALYNSATGRHVLIDLKAGGGTGTYLDTFWGRGWSDAIRIDLDGR